jgi:hypothetical protein
MSLPPAAAAASNTRTMLCELISSGVWSHLQTLLKQLYAAEQL